MYQFALTLGLMVFTSAASAQSNGSVDAPYLAGSKFVNSSDPLAWKITKDSWSNEDEQNYEKFVVAIAGAFEKGQCKTIDACMKTKANPYLSRSDVNFRFYPVDCARLPYLLRSYFAFKNGLPFTYSRSMRARDPNDPRARTGLHYTSAGNLVARRTDSRAQGQDRYPEYQSFQNTMMESVYTATLRTAHLQSITEPVNDLYTIGIDRGSIRPGTVVYYPEGHASVVYQVLPDGSVKTFDAHPGNYLSIRVLGKGYIMRYSKQEWGGGLRNFRPVRLVGATRDALGNLVGGKLTVALDNQIPLVDYTQVKAKDKFSSGTEYMSFFAMKLATSHVQKDLLSEFTGSMDELCTYVQGRQAGVNKAVADGIDDLARRLKLPKNLLVGDGDDGGMWADLATFGRDTNIKRMYKDMLDELKLRIHLMKKGDTRYVFRGTDLAKDLHELYVKKALACKLEYVSRSGLKKTIHLEEFRNRLFKLSSDPQMCTDYRWGDESQGDLLCKEDKRWFKAQQFLRNLTDRQTVGTAEADIAIEQLEIENLAKNKPFSWDTDLISYFQTLKTRDVPVTPQVLN